jgi:hypothetical protein
VLGVTSNLENSNSNQSYPFQYLSDWQIFQNYKPDNIKFIEGKNTQQFSDTNGTVLWYSEEQFCNNIWVEEEHTQKCYF